MLGAGAFSANSAAAELPVGANGLVYTASLITGLTGLALGKAGKIDEEEINS